MVPIAGDVARSWHVLKLCSLDHALFAFRISGSARCQRRLKLLRDIHSVPAHEIWTAG